MRLEEDLERYGQNCIRRGLPSGQALSKHSECSLVRAVRVDSPEPGGRGLNSS